MANKEKGKRTTKVVKEKKVKLTKEQGSLMITHKKFRGKQNCPQARAIRRKLRSLGIKISRMGHHAGLHD